MQHETEATEARRNQGKGSISDVSGRTAPVQSIVICLTEEGPSLIDSTQSSTSSASQRVPCLPSTSDFCFPGIMQDWEVNDESSNQILEVFKDDTDLRRGWRAAENPASEGAAHGLGTQLCKSKEITCKNRTN